MSLDVNGEEREMKGNGMSRISVPVVSLALIVSELLQLPAEYSLEQAYPDPFNPRTSIVYTLPVESRVRIRVYNVLGQLVATLIDAVQTAGRNSTVWDASNNSSGIYVIRIDAASTSGTGKPFIATTKIVFQK